MRIIKFMVDLFRPRPLIGLAEIESYTRKTTGTVLGWLRFVDWPGTRVPGGPWIVSQRDLAKWMKAHGFTREPEQIAPVRRRPKPVRKARWSGPATRRARW